jgi:DNA repair exonuclease SbcCD ATPase subunit
MYWPYIEEYKEYTKEIGDVQYDCDRLAKTNQEKEKSEQLYELTRAKNSALIDANNAQIALLQENIQSLHTQKQDLYSLGIIPPDYRTMDCVIMLHQIFRNGLKDNMADAILLYEERVYRQEIIRGIEKIYDMLGQLNDSMRAIESRLIEVKQELQMIGSDMSNQLAAIADNQSRILSEMEDANEAQAAYAAAQEQWQREQLAETRASRYAAEAVQRSNEKFEWYMDQHRRGFM